MCSSDLSIINPAKDLSKSVYAIQKGLASVERVDKILKAESNIVSPAVTKPITLNDATEYGIHFPLHEGTEVMLSFVQGNPDRPYISGVMHDSAHPDHIPADWNTRNVIRTWANNKLRMEDQKGQEHIKLATDYQRRQIGRASCRERV